MSSTSSTSRSTSTAHSFGWQFDGSDLALGLGADMPDLPGGTAFLHHRQDLPGRLCNPAGVGDRAGGLGGRGAAPSAPSPRRACGPPSTAAASSSQVARCSVRDAGFVFGVAGLQGGLLGQLQRFDRGRWSAVDHLEVDRELAAADVDAGAAGGPARVQSWVDADDLPDRPLPRVGVGPFGEPDPEAVAEVLLQRGVVGFRRRDVGLEQIRPSMDSQRPSRVCTLLATATWVCRSGSPARLSRWVNAAATRPRTSTCRIPCGPVRVNRACCLDEPSTRP